MSGHSIGSSEWKKLFSFASINDADFNEKNFPLEEENDVRELVVKQFRLRSHYSVVSQWADSNGLKLALPRAVGLCLLAKPSYLEMGPVFGGGLWDSGHGNVWVPVFYKCQWAYGIYVIKAGVINIKHLTEIASRTIWLFSKK